MEEWNLRCMRVDGYLVDRLRCSISSTTTTGKCTNKFDIILHLMFFYIFKAHLLSLRQTSCREQVLFCVVSYLIKIIKFSQTETGSSSCCSQ